MSLRTIFCALRQYHRPRQRIVPQQPLSGHALGWAEAVCPCGWRSYLPFITTAAGVLFTCDRIGQGIFKWKAEAIPLEGTPNG